MSNADWKRTYTKKGETWAEFERRVGENKKGAKKQSSEAVDVPCEITVQLMSPTPSGRLKKYEPLETREYVDYGNSGFDELSIANIKLACELHFKAPPNSCDVLASDRGLSCSRFDQIKGKKVILVRFLHLVEGEGVASKKMHIKERSPPKKPFLSAQSTMSRSEVPQQSFPKSICISQLLKAGRLIKPVETKTVAIKLEKFSVTENSWQLKDETWLKRASGFLSCNLQPASNVSFD